MKSIFLGECYPSLLPTIYYYRAHACIYRKDPFLDLTFLAPTFLLFRELKSFLGSKWTSFGPTSTCVCLLLPSPSATSPVSFHTREWRARNNKKAGEKNPPKNREKKASIDLFLSIQSNPFREISKGYVFLLVKTQKLISYLCLTYPCACLSYPRSFK